MANYKSYDTLMSEAIQKVQNEFGTGASDCVSLDLLIKRLSDKIVSERLKSNPDNYYLKALEDIKTTMEFGFTNNSCSQKIEKSRQIESGLLLTKGAIESEESVLTKNNVEQKIYIGLGALVLLVGLYIIVKK